MGFIDTLPQSTELPIFYNVVHAVGVNAPNAPNDVKLIQYLLMAFYARFPEKTSGEMSVTGYCGPVTRNRIINFQMLMNKKFPCSVMLDGRIDRVRNNSTFTSISKTQYTLTCLNSSVKFRNPEAFVALPTLIPLENPMNVPPPSWDTVSQQSQVVPASGGM